MKNSNLFLRILLKHNDVTANLSPPNSPPGSNRRNTLGTPSRRKEGKKK